MEYRGPLTHAVDANIKRPAHPLLGIALTLGGATQ
jgi:hypothetical protein